MVVVLLTLVSVMAVAHKTNILLFIFLCLGFLYIALFPFTTNFIYRFFIDGILFLIFGIILLRINPFTKIKGAIFVFAPFITLHFIFALFNLIDGIYPTIPLLTSSILGAIIAYNCFNKSSKTILLITVSYTAILFMTAYFLPNYYAYTWDARNEIQYGKSAKDLKFHTKDGKQFDINQLKGKITVFDLWTTTCSVCIAEFPKYDMVKKEFDEKQFNFYTLNIPIRGDEKKDISKYTSSYSFYNLYGDTNVAKQLNLNVFPQYLIIDKNLNIRYLGSMNIEKNSIYNNFYNIISKIENEK